MEAELSVETKSHPWHAADYILKCGYVLLKLPLKREPHVGIYSCTIRCNINLKTSYLDVNNYTYNTDV